MKKQYLRFSIKEGSKAWSHVRRKCSLSTTQMLYFEVTFYDWSWISDEKLSKQAPSAFDSVWLHRLSLTTPLTATQSVVWRQTAVQHLVKTWIEAAAVKLKPHRSSRKLKSSQYVKICFRPKNISLHCQFCLWIIKAWTAWNKLSLQNGKRIIFENWLFTFFSAGWIKMAVTPIWPNS